MSTPLIFIPGFLPTESDFESLLGALDSNRETHVLLPSVVADAQTFEQRAQDWFVSVDKNLPAQFYLFGYSMGGRISMAVAQWLEKKQPGRLKGLVLEAAHPGLVGEAEKIARFKNDNEWAQRFRTESMPVVLADWYAQSMFSDASERQRGQWVQAKSLLSGESMAQLIMHFSLSVQPDFRDFLKETSLPVTYVVGDCDLKFANLGGQLEGVECKVAPECGHNIHQQNAQWLANILNTLD